MDKQTIEFQTQVPSTDQTLFCPAPKSLLQARILDNLPMIGGGNQICNKPEGEGVQDNEQDLWALLQVTLLA